MSPGAGKREQRSNVKEVLTTARSTLALVKPDLEEVRVAKFELVLLLAWRLCGNFKPALVMRVCYSELLLWLTCEIVQPR